MQKPQPMHHLPLNAPLLRELRSDHAGEAGAVQIYRGILALTRNPEIREFAREHLQTEKEHLAFFNAWLGPQARTRALPLWRLAGWLLGASAALGGARLVYATIERVETFVDTHYLEQIHAMADHPELDDLRRVLESFREDELHHRDDAADRRTLSAGPLMRGWAQLIDTGSRAGVVLARRL